MCVKTDARMQRSPHPAFRRHGMLPMALCLALFAACGHPPAVSTEDTTRCDEILADGGWADAAACYGHLSTASTPIVRERAAVGELLSRTGLMIEGTWAKIADLAPLANGDGGFLCATVADPRFEEAAVSTRARMLKAMTSLQPEGIPLNVVLEEMFARGLSEAVAVRDGADALLRQGLRRGHRFDLPLPIRLADFSPMFRQSSELLRLEGRFGRLELVHLKALAASLAGLIQLVEAHDLTITDLGSLLDEPNFTTVLARETNLLSLRDPAKLENARRSLAMFAGAVTALKPAVEDRFGERDWLIETRDLHADGRFDPRDLLIYTFIRLDMINGDFRSLLDDRDLEAGWVTFPSSWPLDFFGDLTDGLAAVHGNLTQEGPAVVPLRRLAPALALLRFNTGPLVDLMGLDPAALFEANRGLRDYLPFYACPTADFCLPIESAEYVSDTTHFADAITSVRPITPEQEAHWANLLARNGYNPDAVDHAFSHRATLPADGIHYPVGQTGPANIYRLYRDPTFGGALVWDLGRFRRHLDPVAAQRLDSGIATAGDQYLTNAVLAHYTRETRKPSPFTDMKVFTGLRFSKQTAGEEFGCRIARSTGALEWLLMVLLPATLMRLRRRRPS